MMAKKKRGVNIARNFGPSTLPSPRHSRHSALLDYSFRHSVESVVPTGHSTGQEEAGVL